MSNEYYIRAHDIIEKGVKQVEFDPSKLKVTVSDRNYGEWGNEGYQRVFVEYQDEDLAQIMAYNNYHINWSETIFKAVHQARYTSDRKSIVFFKRVEHKLRKKPNVKGYTDKSIKEFDEKADKVVETYTDVDFLHTELKKLFKHFNEWYAEEQKKKVVETYGDIYGWKWETVEEIVAMDEEIKAMQKKLDDLRNKKFDKQCSFAVEFVKDKAEKIAEEFKQPLIDEIERKRMEGYKSPFFR
jgi:hypothetical protein